IGGASGDSLGWVPWLPIKINTLGVEFNDIEHHPEDFTLLLSASVTSLKGVSGLQFSGSIEGGRIPPALLLQGTFPGIGIDSFGVTITGGMFGGQVNAGLIGGILKIHKEGNTYTITESNDENDIFARVLFVAVQGGFSMGGMSGFTIQFAMSQ